MSRSRSVARPGRENARSVKWFAKEKTGTFSLSMAIQDLRREMGLTGAELCRRSGDLDPKTLTAVEKGRIKNPSIATLRSLAKGFGINVSGLFQRAESMDEGHFRIGNQKGLYKMDFSAKKVQIISFTPLAAEFFCGKIILEIDGSFDQSLFASCGAFFVMVLVGQAEGEAEGKKIVLKEGESFFLRGGIRFRLRNSVQKNTSLLLVTVPSCVSSGISYVPISH